MDKNQVNNLISQNSENEAIRKLSEEVMFDYDEYVMLKLAQLHYDSGNTKDAKKIIRKIQRLFPMGEYTERIQELKDKVEGKTDISLTNLEKKSSSLSNIDTGMLDSDSKEEVISGVKEEIIPENIDKYFKNLIGQEHVKNEIEKLYNLLCLENDRKSQSYNQDLIENYHFVIVGNRGSGKTMIANIICQILYAFNIHPNDEAIIIRAREIASSFHNGGENGIKELFSQTSSKSIIIENFEEIESEYPSINLTSISVILENIMKEDSLNRSIIITGNSNSIDMLTSLNSTISDALYSIIKLKRYTVDELVAITEKLVSESGLQIHPDAKSNLKKIIEREYDNKNFLNAIALNRYIEEATTKMAKRYKSIKQLGKHSVSEKDMVYLLAKDFGDQDTRQRELEKLLAELNYLTGLNSVKEEIATQINLIKTAQSAKEAGVDRSFMNESNHMLFLGNPGTGKTTVAKLIGEIYHNLGILSEGHTVMCSRADLVAGYVGQTAPLVKAYFEKAMGGVLFIDEAYSLINGERDSFGQEAVDELTMQVEENRKNVIVILAGYPDNMKQFMKSNPGINSRFPNKIIFEDYTTDEMVEIFKSMVKRDKMKLGNLNENMLYDFILEKSRKKDFGNARGVRNAYDEIKNAMNSRILEASDEMKKDKKLYVTIVTEDFQAVQKDSKTVSKSLDDLLEELKGLTGLASVKKKVNEMINKIKLNKHLKDQGKDISENLGTLHLIFTGAPGTGKTTVARLLGKIYKELGVLKKDVFVEVARKDLIGRYQGQTTARVEEVVKEAEGGILFIDEAYSLNFGEGDTFGHEIINTLVTILENKREDLMVILAGYADEMYRFLDVNPGLSSRLPDEIYFEDYTMDELVEIFKWMVEKKEYSINFDFEDTIKKVIKKEKDGNKDFGNARGIRNILDRIMDKWTARMVRITDSGQSLSDEDISTLIEDDFIID